MGEDQDFNNNNNLFEELLNEIGDGEDELGNGAKSGVDVGVQTDEGGLAQAAVIHALENASAVTESEEIAKNYDTFMNPEKEPGSEEMCYADWHDVRLQVNRIFAKNLKDIGVSMKATDFCRLKHRDLARVISHLDDGRKAKTR